MAQVLLEGVSKIYDKQVEAVKDVTLHIRDEEFIVLVGPSGCGKSTTLRMIAGLEDISRGTIQIGERVVNDIPPKDRDIAMVFQNYALYPHMTVYNNMAFALKLRKISKQEIDRRVNEAAAILSIEPLLKRKPRQLSGGQRQRVAVGRAIVREPACFLFDEPLSNLDAKLRVETRAELKRLHRKLQTTTIYVTHDQEEAMTLGDRVVVMSNGVIQQVASPLEVYNRPVNRFVAGFVGTPPMNFIEGKLMRDAGLWFESPAMRLKLNDVQAEAATDYIDRDIVLGLRPECMELRPNDSANCEDQSASLQIDVVEPLGNMMDVYLSGQGLGKTVARVKAERVDEQTQHRFYIDMSRVHLFEPGEYGKNITLPTGVSISADMV